MNNKKNGKDVFLLTIPMVGTRKWDYGMGPRD